MYFPSNFTSLIFRLLYLNLIFSVPVLPVYVSSLYAYIILRAHASKVFAHLLDLSRFSYYTNLKLRTHASKAGGVFQ